MSQGYRTLRLYLNSKHPRASRVIDVESGEDILVTDVQINFGYASKFQLKVQLLIEAPGIEIVMDEPPEASTAAELLK